MQVEPSALIIEWDGRLPVEKAESAALSAGFRKIGRVNGPSPPPSVPAALVGVGLDPRTISAVRTEAELEGWNSLLIYPTDLSPVEVSPDSERDALLIRMLAAARIWCERSSAAASVTPVISTPSGPVRRRDLLRAGATLLRRKEHPVLSSPCGGSLAESCRACVEACPEDAISLVDGTVTVDRAACEACGLCASVCPVGALEVPTMTSAQFRGMLEASLPPADRKRPWILVLTSEDGLYRLSERLLGSGGVDAAIFPWRMPSAAAASPAALLQAASAFDGIVLYFSDPGEVPDGVPDSLTWLRAIEGVSGRPVVLGAGGDPMDRIFEVISKLGSHPLHRPGGLPPWTGQYRRDLTSAILYLSPPEVPPEIGVYNLSVSDACTLCGSCEAKCPEGAIKVRTEGEEVVLRLSPARCVGCGLCADVCPEDAIEVVGGLSDPEELAWDASVVRQSSPLARCRRCGRPLGPKKALDRVAAKLREDGLESLVDQVYLCGDCKLAEALGL